ncbi:MAG: hypothetical protein HYY40_02735 [Bacteroidetes bacterium]|nr:hypothetical protein [Bacteroidota bacterium]
MRNLSDREVRTITAIAEVLVPQDGPFPYGYKDVDITGFIEDFLSHTPFRVKWFVYLNLWIFEYFSWIALMSPGIFSRMKFEKRKKIILAFRKNKYFAIRGIYLFTSIVLLMAFYNDEKVMDSIGYYGYKDGVNKIK